jgi:transcriptional regulator with XRE-family HTH domain
MVHIIDGPHKDFASRLLDTRRKKEYTQEDLAKAIKADKRSISMYENGRTFPREDTIRRLAQELEVEADWLATGIDKEMRDYFAKQDSDLDANSQNHTKRVDFLYIEKWDELRGGPHFKNRFTYSASPKGNWQCSDLSKFVPIIKSSIQNYGAVEYPGDIPSRSKYPVGTIIIFKPGHKSVDDIPSGTEVIYKLRSEDYRAGLRTILKEPGVEPVLIPLKPSYCLQPIPANNVNIEIIGVVKSVIINN